MAAAEKEVNTKAAQQALVHAREEEAAAAKHMAADERAQERELAKNGPTYSVRTCLKGGMRGYFGK